MARAIASLIALGLFVAGANALNAAAFRARTLEFSAAERVVQEVGGVTLRGTATHYDWAGGGGNTCEISDPMCAAPSDGWDALWSGALKMKSKCTNESCFGTCKSCCKKPGPGCHYHEEGGLCTANGGYLCVRCVDKRKGVCKNSKWIKVRISDACPRYHPCNTCKGKENPCAQGLRNIDLCDGAYAAIANIKKQPDWKGAIVDVSTNLSNC